MIAPFAETLDFKTDRRSILENPLFNVPALGHSDQIPEVRMHNCSQYFMQTNINFFYFGSQNLGKTIFFIIYFSLFYS